MAIKYINNKNYIIHMTKNKGIMVTFRGDQILFIRNTEFKLSKFCERKLDEEIERVKMSEKLMNKIPYTEREIIRTEVKQELQKEKEANNNGAVFQT
jgi:hypothetical protein